MISTDTTANFFIVDNVNKMSTNRYRSERYELAQKLEDRLCCQTIHLTKIHDPRGNLTFVEGFNHIPFNIKRVYWIYDSPGGEIRGGRACQNLQEFIIAISGSFDVVLDNGQERKVCTLNRSYFGLYIPPMTWRWMENFSTNSFALVLASKAYEEEDYIRDYAEFIRLKLK